MIAKPAVLECARCGKIFIGWETSVRPKGGPRCLKCRAREAWDVLASTVVPEAGRGAGAKAGRTPKRAKRGVARKSAVSRAAPKAAKRSRAKR